MSNGQYRYVNGKRYTFAADGRWWHVLYSSGGDDYGAPVPTSVVMQHTAHHSAGMHTRHHGPSYHHASRLPGQSQRVPSGHVNPWSGERVDPRDGLADNPLAQALFHSTMGSHMFYYAPYQLAGFVAAPFAGAFFLTPFFPAAFLLLEMSHRRNPQGYRAANTVLHDFLFGTTDQTRLYLENSVATQSLMRSRGVQQMLNDIRNQHRSGLTHGGSNTGSWQAFRNIPYDLMYSPMGGQVGGDVATWAVQNGHYNIIIRNDAGARSFFFHGIDDLPNDWTGPFNTIHQTFVFTAPLEDARK